MSVPLRLVGAHGPLTLRSLDLVDAMRHGRVYGAGRVELYERVWLTTDGGERIAAFTVTSYEDNGWFVAEDAMRHLERTMVIHDGRTLADAIDEVTA